MTVSRRKYRIPICILVTFLAILAGLSLLPVSAQDHSAPAPAPHATPLAPPQLKTDFLAAADEVLAQMSEILHLPATSPLKKSLRSRDEIRGYVLKEFDEDRNEQKRQADELLLKKLGLLPEDFALQSALLDILTEQIAGLYDPKSREFYIADWIPPADQGVVMAHELTHALQDQHFSIDHWADAAKPNDDAELARHAVLEGSAFDAMMDWQFRNQGTSVRDLPDLGALLDPRFITGGEKDSKFDAAPAFIRDTLLFPYLSGAAFSQRLLQEYSGWEGFNKIFERPPASTQQILHPDLYLRNVAPAVITLPALPAAAASRWKKLDETVAGEFFFQEWLKQFAGDARAKELAPLWAGDRYAIYMDAASPKDAKSPRVLVVWRIRAESDAEAARLFGGMSQSVEERYAQRSALLRRPNYFEFTTPQGGVFLRCLGSDCLLVDGADRALYDGLTRAIGWPLAPAQPPKTSHQNIARLLPRPRAGVTSLFSSSPAAR
jgi:hypothetical protein